MQTKTNYHSYTLLFYKFIINLYAKSCIRLSTINTNIPYTVSRNEHTVYNFINKYLIIENQIEVDNFNSNIIQF